MKKYEVWNAEAKGESGNVPVVLIDCNANAVVAVPLGTNADEERLPTHALVLVDGPSVIAIAYCEEAVVLDKGILAGNHYRGNRRNMSKEEASYFFLRYLRRSSATAMTITRP